MQYVAYHIDDHLHKSVPIAAGTNKAETLGLAARRVLMLGVTWGGVAVQEQNNLTSLDFQCLIDMLDEYFTEKAYFTEKTEKLEKIKT
ncbi:MAG TPA: hypothetical protein VEP90_18970 [Methylomirabilota bacterium]|nr:hypothetical protein [Methylomirabilota bacterium]